MGDGMMEWDSQVESGREEETESCDLGPLPELHFRPLRRSGNEPEAASQKPSQPSTGTTQEKMADGVDIDLYADDLEEGFGQVWCFVCFYLLASCPRKNSVFLEPVPLHVLILQHDFLPHQSFGSCSCRQVSPFEN